MVCSNYHDIWLLVFRGWPQLFLKIRVHYFFFALDAGRVAGAAGAGACTTNRGTSTYLTLSKRLPLDVQERYQFFLSNKIVCMKVCCQSI